jgi:glutathione S-transferase
MTSPITFWTNPQSRGRTARWMLEEVGVPYDVVVLDWGTTMKAPEYLAINPMGKVPAIRHAGQVVTETAAICAYLAETFPAAGLMGQDRASFLRWLFFAAGPLEQAIVERALGFTPPKEREVTVGYGTFDHVIDTLEAVVARGFVAGGFSAADLYLGSQLGWGMMFGTIPARPAFVAYWDSMKDRPARLRADAADNALAATEQTNAG